LYWPRWFAYKLCSSSKIVLTSSIFSTLNSFSYLHPTM